MSNNNTRYHLSYTAAEIDERLGKIDEISDIHTREIADIEDDIQTILTQIDSVVKDVDGLEIPTKLGDLEDDIGVISESERGIANGIATLDDDGKIPQSQLPTIDANGTYVGDEAPTNTKLLWVDVDDNSDYEFDDIIVAVNDQIIKHNTATNAHTDIRELINALPTKSYVDSAIAAIPTPDVSGQINAHDTSTTSHNDIRVILTKLIEKINKFLDVDDETSDQLSEVLTLIDNNRGTLESLTTTKVNVSDIMNNLTTNDAKMVLSAAQGVELKRLIDAIKIPTTLPASDVYDWAKQQVKPTYTAAEVGAPSTEQFNNLSTRLDTLEASIISVLSGKSAPTSDIGEDGDLYLVTE